MDTDAHLSPARVFGRQLASWRNRAGLIQEKVAREASISLSYFRKIESGTRLLLDRDRSPAMWAILDEGVLRRCIGGLGIMRIQCRHLQEMASRPDIVIRVIPLSTGAHEGLSGGFVIADLPEGKPPAPTSTTPPRDRRRVTRKP